MRDSSTNLKKRSPNWKPIKSETWRAAIFGAGIMAVVIALIIATVPDIARVSRGSAVGVYYVLTYVGFALPFIHAVAARHLGDAPTLLAAAAAALLCLLIRIAVRS